MSADNSPKTDPATSRVWLWERKPLSIELGKVRIPASWVPDGWLPQLQHRYDAGDRIRRSCSTATTPVTGSGSPTRIRS